MKKLALAALAALALAAAGCTSHAAVKPPAAPVAAAAAQPDPDAAKMPDGAGKPEVATLCAGCHSLARVVRQHQTRAQWQDTLQSMQDNGLSATQAQLTAMLDYLAKNYGPAQP
ncbi:MAG: hypothetical protein ACRD1E_08820 [Terriglobales bacterium]